MIFFKLLFLDETNRNNFESIHNSLFVLCLDTNDGPKEGYPDEKSADAAQILHGNKKFSSNRWFDKTVQVNVKF